MNNEKIAKMMGHTRWSANDDFSSPEWQQTIRDRVRELCDAVYYEYGNQYPVGYKHQTAMRLKDGNTWRGAPRATESSAWLAALEFLYDKEQSNEKA